MRVIGNFLWFIFGGAIMGLGWWLFGLVAIVSVVGLPWAKSCFVIGQFSFFPFGKEAINRRMLTSKDDIGTSGFGSIGNIIWLLFAGIWLAIGHLLSALIWLVTIIGIPFGIQHLKLAGVSLFPIGQKIVSKEVAEAARKSYAEDHVNDLRSA